MDDCQFLCTSLGVTKLNLKDVAHSSERSKTNCLCAILLFPVNFMHCNIM